jgi:site-specific DNA-methyltransferase (adenine-specific)
MKTIQVGKAALIHGDCMEYMSTLQDKAFDLAVVDPPYGIGENGDRTASRSKLATAKNYKSFAGGDREPPTKEYFLDLHRVSKNQVIWGANHFLSRFPLDSPCWIVWDKLNAGDFADCELAYTSFKTAVRKFEFRWAGMLQGDMKNKETRIHPTQKPVKLYEWILTNYAKPGQRILDTHGGSMSSVIAALNLGFEIVCIEKDEDYFNAAVERVIKSQQQQRMFE